MRGLKYHGGYHDFTIERGGIWRLSRLIASTNHHRRIRTDPVYHGSKRAGRALAMVFSGAPMRDLAAPAGVGLNDNAVALLISALKAVTERRLLFCLTKRLSTLIDPVQGAWHGPGNLFIDNGMLQIGRLIGRKGVCFLVPRGLFFGGFGEFAHASA